MKEVKIATQSVSGLVAVLWFGLPMLIQALIVMMVLDIVSGLIAAFVAGELSSTTSFRGMAKKAMVLILVGAASWLEPVVGIPLAQAVAGFYIVHEVLSIIENAAKAGLPVPGVLKEALERLSPASK